MEGLSGVLRLTAVALEALSRFEATTIAGFGVLLGVSLRGDMVRSFVSWVFYGGSRPKRTRHMPLASVSVECSLCTALPGLPVFFCQPYAV